MIKEKKLQVLFVCSGNKGRINPFIAEQAEALEAKGVSVSFFTIQGKGFLGYLKSMQKFHTHLKKHSFDIVHAHYGLSGLMCVFQKQVPVVITFHGSDVNNKRVLRFSKWAAKRAAYNVVVEKSFRSKLGVKANVVVLPCGINLDTFHPLSRTEAREKMQIPEKAKIVLFTSAFNNPVKNYPLAKESMVALQDASLMELKGYDRQQVNLLMNAADVLLVTSFSEGSPQVVKEALACDLPVVSTPVGDVKELIKDIEGTYIVPYEAGEISKTLEKVLNSNERVRGRQKMKTYDNATVAEKLIAIYKKISAA